MVHYECKRCGYTTKHKGSFINHLERKNICHPILQDVDRETIKKFYNLENIQRKPKVNPIQPNLNPNEPNLTQSDEPKKNPKKPKNNPFLKKMNPNEPKITQNNPKSFFCSYCSREFSRNWHLTRHMNSCKMVKNEIDELKRTHEKEKKELVEVMKTEMKETVENLIIKMSNSGLIGNTTNNDNSHSYNSNNTIHNTININNYGCENMNYLNKEYLNTLLEGAFTALPKLIENIHFNPEHPENHNIKITNKKQPFVKVLKDDQWQLQDKQETLDNLLDEKYDILEHHYAKLEEKEKTTDKMDEVMTRFRDRYTGDKELQKKLNKDTELIILNKSGVDK